MTNRQEEDGDGEDYSDALPINFELGDYKITGYLGRGSFGITYRASETKLRRDVAIKEYMPREWARRYADHSIGTVSRKTGGTFRYGLERFTMEAQNLAACRQENIVKVHRLLEENQTSYMVMELLDGETLEARIEREGRIVWDELAPIFEALAKGCRDIHRRGILHRDIKPANIVLRLPDNHGEGAEGAVQPVLIDFGAAREIRRQAGGKLSAILTEEYAPLEQWSDTQDQGPYTDIYALAATISHALTGVVPKPAPTRRWDEAGPLRETAKGLAPDDVLDGLDHGLRIEPAERPQSISQWLDEMPSLTAGPAEPARRTIDRRAILALGGAAALAGIAGWLVLSRSDIRSSGRPLRVVWHRVFDPVGQYSLNPAVAIAPDGALVTASIASGGAVHMLALRLDADGNERVRWVSDAGNGQGFAIVPAPGGGAFVGGGVDMVQQDSGAASGRGLLVRLNRGFSELWRTDFDGAILNSLLPQGTSEVVAAFDGVQHSGVAMLQRVGGDGQRIGGPIELNNRQGDSARKVIALPNGTFAVLGLRESRSSHSIWVACVNTRGDELWRASDAGAIAEHHLAWSEGWDLAVAGDSLFVVGRGVQAGLDSSEPDNPQFLHRSIVMRLDLTRDGSLRWLHADYERAPTLAIHNASAGCVAAVGTSEPAVYVAGWQGWPRQGWVRQIDGDGDVVWAEEVGDPGFVPTQLQLDESGGYLVGFFNPPDVPAKLMVVRLARV